MKKKTTIRIISFLSAGIVFCLGLYFKELDKSKRYALVIENEFSGALNELNASLNNIAMVMNKFAHTDSAGLLSTYTTEIYGEAEIAKTALSKLPSGEGELNTIYRFLSQVGNYALSVSKDVIEGKEISKKQSEEIKSLGEIATLISDTVSETQINFNNPSYWSKEVEEGLSDSIDDESLATTLTQLEEDLSDYPKLIYDGPFSDHILDKQPLMTSNAQALNKQEAQLRIKEIFSVENIGYDGLESGKIMAYRFKNDTLTATISKQGGYLVYMRKNRQVGDSHLSYHQALAKAKEFLSLIQIKNMINTYYYTDGGICVINFAYLDGQTICYTDLIKVGVALDTGEIMFYEASGYLTNHTDRAFETPKHTDEEAFATLGENLTLKQTAIALIPTDSGGEVRCYEFLCDTEEGREILFYVNLKTLETEDIMILLKSDGGTLVK